MGAVLPVDSEPLNPVTSVPLAPVAPVPEEPVAPVPPAPVSPGSVDPVGVVTDVIAEIGAEYSGEKVSVDTLAIVWECEPIVWI